MKQPEEYLTRGKGNFINCTDYDDAIAAMKQYAQDYHQDKVKNLSLSDVSNSVCVANKTYQDCFFHNNSLNGCLDCGNFQKQTDC